MSDKVPRTDCVHHRECTPALLPANGDHERGVHPHCAYTLETPRTRRAERTYGGQPQPYTHKGKMIMRNIVNTFSPPFNFNLKMCAIAIEVRRRRRRRWRRRQRQHLLVGAIT